MIFCCDTIALSEPGIFKAIFTIIGACSLPAKQEPLRAVEVLLGVDA